MKTRTKEKRLRKTARARPAYRLHGLIRKITPKNRHAEVDWGTPYDREAL